MTISLSLCCAVDLDDMTRMFCLVRNYNAEFVALLIFESIGLSKLRESS